MLSIRKDIATMSVDGTKSVNGTIISIQRFSIHDGPGIRTTVFFKGCSLRCFWCHNPESIRPKPEIQFSPDRCIACLECLTICPQGAHQFTGNGHEYTRDVCTVCGQCVDLCCTAAVEVTGVQVSTESVMDEVMADRAFYASSGGGVTLSGGEPLMQRDFAQTLLAQCKDQGIHTAIETAANCRWEDLASLLPVTDLFMMDIKQMDPTQHKAATGVSNERILANARRMAESGKPILFRTPVVPTVNDSPDDIRAIARFVHELGELGVAEQNKACGLPQYELLSFHRLAADKYTSLGLDYRAAMLEAPSKEQMGMLTDIAREENIVAKFR